MSADATEKNRLITIGIWYTGIKVALTSGLLFGVGAFLLAATGASLLHRLIMSRGLYE